MNSWNSFWFAIQRPKIIRNIFYCSFCDSYWDIMQIVQLERGVKLRFLLIRNALLLASIVAGRMSADILLQWQKRVGGRNLNSWEKCHLYPISISRLSQKTHAQNNNIIFIDFYLLGEFPFYLLIFLKYIWFQDWFEWFHILIVHLYPSKGLYETGVATIHSRRKYSNNIAI